MNTQLEAILLPFGIASIKATLLLAVAGLAGIALRRKSAAVRHALWTGALAAAVAMAILPLALPAWRVLPVPMSDSVRPEALPAGASTIDQVPALSKNPDASRQIVTTEAKQPLRVAATTASTSAKSVAAESSSTPLLGTLQRNWRGLLVGLWLVGAILLAFRYLASAIRLHRLANASLPFEQERLQQEMLAICAAFGLRRRVTLLRHPNIEVPMTWGVFRPCVFLPFEAETWPEERVRAVLLHELAHVKRWDALTQWLSHAACALYWFHPLLWKAARELRFERERACDDFVLAHGATASGYAADLLAIVSAFGGDERYPVALAMARRSQFEGRLLAVLDAGMRRDALSPRGFAVLVALGLLLLPLAAARPAEPGGAASTHSASATTTSGPATTATRSPEAGEATTASSVTLEVSPRAADSKESHAFPASPGDDLLASCAGERETTSSFSSHSDDNGGKWTRVLWKAGRCSLEMKTVGEFTFNEAFTGFKTLSRGGTIDITVTLPIEGVTQLEVRPGNGSLQYKLTRDGKSAEFEPEGAAWLAKFLLSLDRLTAIGIDQRFPSLMRNGGPDGVLDEVGHMYGDYAKATYTLRLLKDASLDHKQLLRVYGLAAAISSDYESARILMGAAEKYPLADEATRSAFLNAVDKLNSDYEHARTLMVLIEKGQGSKQDAPAILASASKLHSDYEAARVLIALTEHKFLGADAREEFLRNADRLNSDYEHARVLMAALDAFPMDDAMALVIIRSAGRIRSDYEAARVLVSVAERRQLKGTLREEYLKAGSGIHSEYERKRVLEAVGAADRKMI